MIRPNQPWLRRISAMMTAVALGGCSADAPPSSRGAHDPVMAAALQAPLLVDPDLSQRNARNLAIVPPGPIGAPVPIAAPTSNPQ